MSSYRWVWVAIRKWLLSKGASIAVWLGYAWIRFVYSTSSWAFLGKENLAQFLEQNDPKPIIICFWHGRMAMMPCAWQWKLPFSMLLSLHRDGALIGRVLKKFNINCTEGSSRRGGAEAFVKLNRLIHEEKTTIGITPDGPKGPLHSVASGVVALSQKTQTPIIATSFSTKRGKHLKTWDEFWLPTPFNKGVFVASKPIYPHELPHDLDEATRIVAEALHNVTHQADAYVQKKDTNHDS